MTDDTLFELPQPYPEQRGHAATPGSGPEGEACGTCEHYTRIRISGTYLKCGLMKDTWTGGPGTDIRKKDPACKHWTNP